MLLWLVFGFVIGVVVNILYPTPSSVLGTILLSILGALLGGFLSTVFLTGSNTLNIVAALSGITVLLFIQRKLLRHA